MKHLEPWRSITLNLSFLSFIDKRSGRVEVHAARNTENFKLKPRFRMVKKISLPLEIF